MSAGRIAHIKSVVKIGDVPGVGTVAAEIKYQVRADGVQVNHMLGMVRYTDMRPLENEHRAAVGKFFDALV